MGGINCHISHRRGPDDAAPATATRPPCADFVTGRTRLSVALVRKTSSFRGGEVGIEGRSPSVRWALMMINLTRNWDSVKRGEGESGGRLGGTRGETSKGQECDILEN